MRGRRGRRVSYPAVGLMACVASSLFLAVAVSAAGVPEYLRSFGPDGTSSSAFERAAGVGVDQQSGAVYVLDHSGSLFKFDSEGNAVNFTGSAGYISGNAITGLSAPSCFACDEVAVDSTSHVVYVTSGEAVTAFYSDGEEAEFTAGPGTGTNRIAVSGLEGIAVDVDGNIYAASHSDEVIRIYAPSGEQITEFSASGAANLAVDTNGTVYVKRSTVSVGSSGVFKYTPSAFPVTSSTSYNEASQVLGSTATRTVAVDPGTNDVYLAESGINARIERYDEEGHLLGTFAGPEEEGEVAEPVGVAVIGSNGRVFVADGRFPNQGPSRVEIFGYVSGRPKVVGTSIADVTADSAMLRAKINPDSFETRYRFEYGLADCGTSTCTSIPLEGVDIGAGTESVAVSQVVTGLQPGTTYHFRVVAENAEGVTYGPDRIFTTQGSGFGFALADDRAWEMVSPPNKYGALLKGDRDSLVQAAADGEGITFPSVGSIEAEPEGSRPFEPASVLARRMTGGNWQSKDITPRNDVMEGLPIGNQGQYKAFNSNLAEAVLEPASPTPLSPGGAPESPYLRQNTEPPTFTSLVPSDLVPADSDPNTHPKVAAVTSDLGHVLLKSELPLVEGAPTSGFSLYLWTDGGLQLVSELPPSEGGVKVTQRELESPATVRHAISNDGSRVFWQTENNTALYLRYNATGSPSAISGGVCTEPAKACTVRLDLMQAGASGSGAEHPIFQGANAEGTIVYFTDSQQLTEGASSEGSDLYRCEIPAGSPAMGCATLTDVSASLEGSGESARAEQLVTGMSDDGSTVFFVAKGVLDVEPNPFGDEAASGRPNLYVWTQGHGARFIATLSERDSNDWGGGEGREYKRSAAASPNGRFLAFASLRSLTGEENLDAASGEAAEQVFRYDADADRLDCISCAPTGAAPTGRIPREFSLVDSRDQWEGRSIAALIPEPPINHVFVNSVFYSPRTVLDSGRVFFNSVDSLVPADSNGQWDVYQYEPTGVGNCTDSSGGVGVARSAGGCVSLISSGTGEEEAVFLDASESGNDVFVLTPAQLNETDQDSEYDVYDARVNGIPATLPHVSECFGEACQPVSSAPNSSFPASAAFNGAGNLKHTAHKRCGKGKRARKHHGRRRCVPRKHRNKRNRTPNRRAHR